METGQQVCLSGYVGLQCAESGGDFGRHQLLSSVFPNLYECTGAAVIFLYVNQPGLQPKGFTELVQSAGGSFPLISFRFSLKAMNTLN